MTRGSPPGRDAAGAGGSVQIDLSTQAVFDYFPAWESRFEHRGGEYGGRVNNYRSAEITILNPPAPYGALLHRYVMSQQEFLVSGEEFGMPAESSGFNRRTAGGRSRREPDTCRQIA